MPLEDYGSMIQSGMNLIPDLNKQLMQHAQTQAYEAQARQSDAEAQATAEKQRRAAQFQQDLYGADGSPTSVSRLIMKYPEFADHLKQGWEVADKASAESDLTQMGELYSAALGNKWDLVAKAVHARHDAEKAAGRADETYSMILDVADKAAAGDVASQKIAKTMIGSAIAAKTGPDHFNTTYTALKGGIHIVPLGGVAIDDEGKMIGHSPMIQDANGKILDWDSVMGGGGQSSPGAAATTAPGMTPAVASVASTLSSALPAPVVAGFLGNFHAEGGYDGAKGDGGSASGIAQWHNDRAANFEKVIGKPVTEATPEEQARFVLHEMQNPQEAGMTVKQRDAIMAAKTPAQAAALIDQYYERSDGKARQGRMAAATAFAGDAAQAPTGSGPRVLLPGRNSPDQYHTLTPDEVKSRGLDPGQQYQLNTQTGQVTGLGKRDAADDDVLGQYHIGQSETGATVLNKLPANMASQVKALAEGRLPMPSSFALAKPYWQKMLQLTAQYDPSFDAANAPARKAAITAFTGMGKGAQVVGSVNRVANHLSTLWDKSQKLAGPDLGNSTLNSLAASAGQSFDPADARAYDTAVGFVAGELEKIARNSPGTEAGVERVVKNLSRKQSLKTRNEAIKTAVDIIAGAVDPLKEQYNSAFTNSSTRPSIPWVSPQAQKVYSRIGGTSGGVDLSLTGSNADSNRDSGASQSSSGVVHVQTAAQWHALKPGTRYIDPTGVQRIKK